MSDIALEVNQLVKRYGPDFVAVDGISFRVPKGAVVGLLGPNGAGKTTTIQMLMGITTPTAGSIRYFGEDFTTHKKACLQRINYTSAYNQLQERITVKENLVVFAGLYEVRNARKKIAELVEYLEIERLMDQMFRDLSAGERTRVNIAKALLNDPELLMMDEPTASLDPDIRDKVMDLIERLQAERQLSILYTSHNMDEVSRLCDDVIFLDRGVILQQASPDELAARVHEPSVAVHFQGNEQSVRDHFAAIEVGVDVRDHIAVFEAEARHLPRILGSIDSIDGVTVTDVDVRKPSLEHAFVQLSRGSDVLAPN